MNTWMRSAAYSYEVGDDWTLLDTDVSNRKVICIYYYRSSGNLGTMLVGGVSFTLIESVTMKDNITGTEFATLDDVNIYFYGYFGEISIRTNHKIVWNLLLGVME